MSSYLDYMNDPDIINEPMPLREVHAIRLMLYDELKSLTPEEHVRLVNERAKEIIEEYGLKTASYT